MKTNQEANLFVLGDVCRKYEGTILPFLRITFLLMVCVFATWSAIGQNIGIGTTTPTQKLDVNGNIKLGNHIMVEGNQANIKIYRNLVSYASNAGSGAFAIHTNQPLADVQWAMVVEGYVYSPLRLFRIYMAGYDDFASSAGCVYEGDDKLPVRFGSESGNLVIIIGDTLANYNYPQIAVTEYQHTYSSLLESYADGWSITRVSNLSAYTGVQILPERSYLQWTESGSNLFRSTGNVGIGLTNPLYKLDVSGSDVRLTNASPYLKINVTGPTGTGGMHFLYNNISRAFIYYNSESKYIKMSNYETGEYNDLILDSNGRIALNPSVMGDITERFTVYGNLYSGIRGFTTNSAKYGVYGMNTATDNYGTLGSNHYGAEGYLGLRIGGNYGVFGQGPMVFTSAGSDYTPIGSLGGVKGNVGYGSYYTYGVAGFTSFDAPRTGGCLGARNSGEIWGCLGYLTSGWAMYGGYFTVSGSGSGDQAGKTGVFERNGIGAYGDLFGADIHGEIYGTYTEGSHYGLYSKGDIYRTGLDVHLQENQGGPCVLYTNVSTEVTVQTSGMAQLSAGKCEVVFDGNFIQAISEEYPVIVTVTPIGESGGLHLASMSNDGFIVEENNSGRSTVQFTYIAIGRRKGFEEPQPAQEVISNDYNAILSRGLHNDGDRTTTGERLYYQDGILRTEKVVNRSPASSFETEEIEVKEMNFEPGSSRR